MQVRAGGSAGGSHRPDRPAALHALALDDGRGVEMEVKRVEAETVVEDHQPPRKEEFGDERDLARIGRNDRRSAGRGEVDPAVGRARLTVDDAARAEPRAGRLAPDGLRELPPPEPVGRDGTVESRQLPALLDGSLF